jgi:hypothetical protein
LVEWPRLRKLDSRFIAQPAIAADVVCTLLSHQDNSIISAVEEIDALNFLKGEKNEKP